MLRSRFRLLLRPRLWRRLSLRLWSLFGSRTLLWGRLSLFRLWLRSRTLLWRGFSLRLWPLFGSRTLLWSRFSRLRLLLRSGMLLWSRLSRPLFWCRLTLLWPRFGGRPLLRGRLGPGLWTLLRSRTCLGPRLHPRLWALLRSRPRLDWRTIDLRIRRARSRTQSGTSRNHRSDRSACPDGLGDGNYRWTSVIDRSKLLAILCGLLLVLQLRGHGRNALLPHASQFRGCRPPVDASRPVVTDPVNRGVVDDRAVVHVGNVSDVYIIDGAIVVKPVVVPVSALIAHAGVAVPIVNTAVIADMLAPEAIVVAIDAGDKSPVSRGPQEAHLRRLRPGAWHPVVTLRSVAPISGCPQIAFGGTRRLGIFRQWWRRLLRLNHRLVVACILGAGIVIGIVLVLVGRGLLLLSGGGLLLSILLWRCLLSRLLRLLLLRGLTGRLLIGLLRRLIGRLLLIAAAGLRAVGGGQVGVIGPVLRLIGLRRLTLRASLLRRVCSCILQCQSSGRWMRLRVR